MAVAAHFLPFNQLQEQQFVQDLPEQACRAEANARRLTCNNEYELCSMVLLTTVFCWSVIEFAKALQSGR
jgi:hypothetical protein